MDAMDEVRRVAERQHGLVTRDQARRAGVGRNRLRRGVERGEWQELTSQVLRLVGARRTLRQQLLAGVLDAGPGAAASHVSAAALWRLPGFGFRHPEVTRGGRRTSRTPPIAILHRPRLLLPHHVTEVDGIPCTSLPRTVFDLAGLGLHPERIGRLVNLVANRSPATLVGLHDMLEELARRGRPGITVMRAVLEDRPPGARLPESGLEARFEQILRLAGQAPLTRQVDVGGHEWLGRVDFADLSLGLLVEVDSELHHSSPEDQARDEARDRAMLAAGWAEVVRVAEETIWRRPERAVRQVAQARARRRRSVAA